MFKKRDYLNPYIIVFLTIIFVLISIPIHFTRPKLIHFPSSYVFLYIFLGIVFLIFGFEFSDFILKKTQLIKKFSKINTRVNNSDSYFRVYLKKLNLFDGYSNLELLLVSLIIFSLVLQLINFYLLGGIPLFSGYLKKKAASKIWFLSFLIFLPCINILLAKYNRNAHYILLLIGIILFSLTGYRTTPIAICLSSFITLYYTREIKTKYRILFLILIVLLLIGIGFIAIKSIEWQHWKINPLELVSYRSAYTINILDKIVYKQGISHGALLYSTLTGFFSSVDPRVLVGSYVISNFHSTTSTIFGPSLLDFGFIGMFIQMFIIGFILKSLHTVQKYKHDIFTAFYAIILAQTIIWLETGPTDLVVWIFYILSIIVLIYGLYEIKNPHLET